MNTNNIKIGVSDYSREQMELGANSYFTTGITSEEYLQVIKGYERQGYTVKFETSWWRKRFRLGKYKVMAYKSENIESDPSFEGK